MSTSGKTADGLTWPDVDGLTWEEADALPWDTYRGLIVAGQACTQSPVSAHHYTPAPSAGNAYTPAPGGGQYV